MKSISDNICRADDIQARQKQFLQCQPDCSRNGIEGQDNFRDDNSFVFAGRVSLVGGNDKSHAAAETFYAGKFRGEGVEHMARFDNRSWLVGLPHPRNSAPVPSDQIHGRAASCDAAERRSKTPEWLTVAPVSFETALEILAEESKWSVLVRPAEGNQSNNSRCAANDTDHECESDKCDQLRVANFTSNANRISNRCTIFPASSPIAAAGASVSPNGSATNSELEGASITTSARAQREPIRKDGFFAPSSSSRGDTVNLPAVAEPSGFVRHVRDGESSPARNLFQSGFSGLNELGRDLPPDNSAEYPSKFIPPFFFSLMAKIPTVLIADLDNQQSTEGKRYEHPRSMDTWSEHERVH